MKRRLERTWMKQVGEEIMKVALSREDALCRSKLKLIIVIFLFFIPYPIFLSYGSEILCSCHGRHNIAGDPITLGSW